MPVGLTNEVKHQVLAGDAQTRFGLISGQGDDAVVEASDTYYRLLGIGLEPESENSVGSGRCPHRLNERAQNRLVSSTDLRVGRVLAKQLDSSEIALHQVV